MSNYEIRSLSNVVSYQWPIHQLDIKNVFLHDVLKEFYVKQLRVFKNFDYPSHICELNKTTLGLK